MTSDLTNLLDTAAERLIAGEPLPVILANYSDQAEALGSLLNTAAALETLRPVEQPAADTLVTDRNEFLAQVAALPQQAVSSGQLSRLKEWIVHSLPWPLFKFTYQRKEQWRMSSLLVKAVIIFGLIFGSVGGTAVMAAQSLPDTPLHPLKLTMEQVRLALTNDSTEQAQQHLNLAQVRTQEMVQVALKGGVPDQATQTRLQQHLRQALRLATQAPEEELPGLLNQARHMLQTQARELAQVQAQVNEPARTALQETKRWLNQVGQAVDAGLQDPQTFRWQYRSGQPVEGPLPPNHPAPGEPGPNPDCPNGECQPLGEKYQHQYGPNAGQPGQHGEPCQTDSCEPVGDAKRYGRDSDTLSGPHEDQDCSGNCEPVGEQHHYGAEPDYGPGTDMPVPDRDCPVGDCQPLGEEYQHQYGPNASQPGQHGEPCQTGSCEPVGDANHHGQETEEPGGPHGDQDCSGECEPVGDQNQNGEGPADQSDGDTDGSENHHGSPTSDKGGGSDGGDDTDNGGSDSGNSDSGNSDSGDSGGSDKNGGKKH